MRQSLNVLQSNSLQLREITNVQLNTNPLLEEIKDDPDTISLDAQSDSDSYDNTQSPTSSNESRDLFFNSIPQSESFQEHLRNQAALEITNPKILSAFDTLADLLDSRGFLPENAIEESAKLGYPKQDLEDALAFMQTCHPAGVGARNFRECFLIQLKRKHKEDSLAYAILDFHFDLLQKRKVQEIARLTMSTVDDVEHAISEIATLDMSPAKTFQDDILYINPDVIFFKKNGKWQCELTNDGIPKLRINNTYRDMVAQGEISKTDASFIKDKIRDAKSLIEALENRQSSLKKLADIILQKQADFFEKGDEHLHPLTMVQVAEIMGVHPTTVSRTVAEKYAKVWNKTLPLKYFFTSGFNADSQNAIANTSIKNKIAEIIKNESPQKPLSDSQIADILKSKNIDIARRTVAKYREELNIPAKSLRTRAGA